MAVNTKLPKLSEAELNAPDLDDDGELAVETYPLLDASDIEDPYLAEVWEAAVNLLESGEQTEDELLPDESLK